MRVGNKSNNFRSFSIFVAVKTAGFEDSQREMLFGLADSQQSFGREDGWRDS